MAKKRRNLVDDKKYHYTYRITNIVDKKYYYGVHSCDCLPHEEIGVTYFSSAKREFIDHQKENPEEYKYKVLKIFSTRAEANKHEEIIHNKFNVKEHDKFYNKHNSCEKFDSSGMILTIDKYGVQHFISNKDEKYLSGELKSYFTGENNGMYGRKRTDEEKAKISAGTKAGMKAINFKGHPNTEETKKQISETLTGRIFVSKDGENKNIYPEELEYYLSLGYQKKVIRKKKNIDVRLFSDDCMEGILVEKEKVDEYLAKGYYKKLKIVVTKDNKVVKIDPHELKTYLNDGCVRGMKIQRKSGTLGTKAMKHPETNKVKYVIPVEFEKYLELGYTFNKVTRK